MLGMPPRQLLRARTSGSWRRGSWPRSERRTCSGGSRSAGRACGPHGRVALDDEARAGDPNTQTSASWSRPAAISWGRRPKSRAMRCSGSKTSSVAANASRKGGVTSQSTSRGRMVSSAWVRPWARRRYRGDTMRPRVRVDRRRCPATPSTTSRSSAPTTRARRSGWRRARARRRARRGARRARRRDLDARRRRRHERALLGVAPEPARGRAAWFGGRPVLDRRRARHRGRASRRRSRSRPGSARRW